MPHLISDAHEWINEIPTVPIYWSATNNRSELSVLEFERFRTYSPFKDWGLTSS